LLNCGNAGTCSGGSVDGPYQWIAGLSTGISYESSLPYSACSSDSSAGFCRHADWSCSPQNVARTCAGFGESCVGLVRHPYASIADYGSFSGRVAMMNEIYHRGTISCGIDAVPLEDYESGIITSPGDFTDHVISVVGWGHDQQVGSYWIIRNSWGEYWGEMGYARVAFGALHVEDHCAWAVLKDFTAPEHNNELHCHTNGLNCLEPAPPAPTPVPPTPPPSPVPPSGASHYSYPPCLSDEVKFHFSANDAVMCMPECVDGQCPEDVPVGVTAQPNCLMTGQRAMALGTTLGAAHTTYCALSCGSDRECGSGGFCNNRSLMCQYPDKVMKSSVIV